MTPCSCTKHGGRLLSRTPADMECPFCAKPLCKHCFEHCHHDCGSEPSATVRESTRERELVPA